MGVGSLPAFAQPTTTSTTGNCADITFQLANPAPGSRMELGNNVISGIALDTRAPTGSTGIDRVDFFLGNRDEGGMSIGTAVPGMAAGPFGPGSFQTTIALPNLIGGHDLFAYAHDAVTGQEGVISLPIALGEDVNKAFVTPPSDTVNETCTPLLATTTIVVTTPTTPTAPTTTTTTAIVSPSPSTIVLQVGNPSPGDTILAGAYVMQGIAMDKAARVGTGIDRIDIFLDNRDEGGMFLGSAGFGVSDVWTATVNLPTNQLGLHNLWVYAHSAVTGAESSVSIPVTIT
jgi:hypothetical protein